MAWITGTATGLKDLLDEVRGHAVAEGWTVNDYDTAGAAPNTDSLYLEGPGYGAGYECYFAIRTYEAAVSNHYCFEVRGATGYDAAQTWDSQPGRSPNIVVMRLWDASMSYWLSITDRRILLIVKCSNTYHSMYAGFFNPFANPVEYPYPMYIAADSGVPGAFGDTETDTRSVAFPGRLGAYLRDPAGTWRPVCVWNSQGDFSFQESGAGIFTVWPYLSIVRSSDNPTNVYRYPPYTRVEPLPGVADSLFVMNCYLTATTQEGGVYGVLEGLYWVPGNTISAEQQLTIDGDDYSVFIAISRSTESPSQFYAVKEA